MPVLPVGQYRPDIADYGGDSSKNIWNALPQGDGYGPFPDYSAFSGALANTCRGAFYALGSDGTVSIFSGTSTRLYKMSNTDFTWSDVSSGGSAYTALPSSGQWKFAQFGLSVIAVQANVAPQIYTIGSSTEFTALAGSPPQASYVDVVGRFLVLSGLTSNPYRVQWSGLNSINAADSWTSGVNSSDYQDFPDGGIVRGVAGGEYGYIFQDGAIRRMTFAPGSSYVFQIDRVAQDYGLYGPNSIVRLGDQILFFTAKGFKRIQPGGSPDSIGRERVDRTFFADLDKGNLQSFMGAADPRSNRAFWAYKSTNGAAGLFDKIIGYDVTLDRWFIIRVSGEYLLGMSQTGLTLENLDSISTSIDALTSSLDSYATSIIPEIAQFNSAHKLGFFRGNNLEATLETSEQHGDGQRLRIRGFRPVTDASSFYGSCTMRDTLSDEATDSNEAAVNTRTWKVDLNKSTRYSRMRLRIPAASSWSFVSGCEPDIVTEGQQ